MLLIRSLRARPRLLVSIAVAALVFLLAATTARLATRLLIAWDVGVGLNLVLVGTMMARSGIEDMQRRADLEDEGAVAVMVLTVVAALASLGAIAAQLRHSAAAPGHEEALRLWLAGLTILLSWFFVHTVFALHYAHQFYAGEDEDRRGLAFPQPDRDPDYWDFLYFSFTIGAASQTSDVAVVEHHMRRFVLAHTILSFLFNTTVLALAINVGAGLLQAG
jgi:uncharacterized membrane protein